MDFSTIAAAGLIALTLCLAALGMRTAATSNNNWSFFGDQSVREFKVAANVHIYRDTFIGRNPAGYAQPLQAGDEFVGIATEECDNTSGGFAVGHGAGTDGEKSCEVRTLGDFALTLTSAAVADIGKPVFATDDSTLSLSGNPRSWVGNIEHYLDTNLVCVRLRSKNAVFTNNAISKRLRWDGSRQVAPVLTAGGEVYYNDGWRLDAIGAGIVAVGITHDPTVGETRMLLDNDNEAENLTIESPYFANITKGVYARFKGRLKTAGGAATDDVDFGIAALSTTGLTDTERANMDATTSGLKSFKAHLDANANDVFLTSDDDSSPVSATDTTVDNSLTVNKTYEFFARPGGSCELWVDGVRKLSTTAFAVSATGIFAAFANLEKSTGTGVPEVRWEEIEICGALS